MLPRFRSYRAILVVWLLCSHQIGRLPTAISIVCPYRDDVALLSESEPIGVEEQAVG